MDEPALNADGTENAHASLAAAAIGLYVSHHPEALRELLEASDKAEADKAAAVGELKIRIGHLEDALSQIAERGPAINVVAVARAALSGGEE
jgi:hypothetical protein